MSLYLRVLLLVASLTTSLMQIPSQAVDRERLYDKSMIYGIDFKYGMPTDDPRFETLRQSMLDMSLEYGAAITRAAVGWAAVEAVRGTPYDWDKADRKAVWISRQGLPVCLNVNTAPEWATVATPEIKKVFEKDSALHLLCGTNIAAEYWGDYERYLAAMVERSGEHITYYDIWNEPDGMGNPSIFIDQSGKPSEVRFGGDPEWYAELLKRTATVLRTLDPGCIIGGGCLEGKDEPTSQFLEDVYTAGGGHHFDAVSMHPYGVPINFNWIRAVRGVMVRNGDADKPIWLTEFGLNWQKSEGHTEEAAAAMTRASLRYMRETPWITMGLIHHATPILWHQDATEPTKLSPRPALIAFSETKREDGPDSSFYTGFENERALTFWYCETDGSRDAYPYLALVDEEAYSGLRSLRAKTDGIRIEVFGSVNVRTDSPVLTFWYKVVPADSSTTSKLSVQARPGNLDILPRILPITDDAPIGRWVKVRVPLAESFAKASGNTIVDIGIKCEVVRPGVTLYLDNIMVR